MQLSNAGRRRSPSRATSVIAPSRWSQRTILATHTSSGASAPKLRNCSSGTSDLVGKLRAERFETPVIQSAASEYLLGAALANLGRFEEAIGHGEAGVRIAEDTDHPFT